MRAGFLALLTTLSLCAILNLGYGDDLCLITALQDPDKAQKFKELLSKYNFGQGDTSLYAAFIEDLKQAMKDIECDFDATLETLGLNIEGLDDQKIAVTIHNYISNLLSQKWLYCRGHRLLFLPHLHQLRNPGAVMSTLQ